MSGNLHTPKLIMAMGREFEVRFVNASGLEPSAAC